jgi:SsrA-binding protein
MNNNEKIEVLKFYDFNDKNKIDSNNNEDNKNSKIKIWLRTIPLIMIPILFLLTVISLHTKRLVKVPFNYISCVLLSIFIYLFIIGLFKIKKSKKNTTKKKKVFKVIKNIILTIYILGCFGFTFLLYGPYDNFRTWLISTAMSTMNHQYLCKWFYNDDEILKVIKGNYILEVNEETNTDLIDMEEEITYDNEYEEGNRFNHDERRERKLLLHKKEIYKIRDKVEKEGYSLVPVKLYLKDGRAKILLGIARGKKLYDKRQSLKEKDIKIEMEKNIRY